MLQLATLQAVKAKRDGYHPLGGARFVFLLFLFFSQSVIAVELPEINHLAKGGASQLALSLLEQHQPSLEESPRHWQRWERVRVRIMQQHGQWLALAEHLAAYPDDLPETFAFWAERNRADALIHAAKYDEARQLLRQMIWLPPNTLEGGELEPLRRLVMTSYLEEGRIGDAYAAMQRYQQDYRDQGRDAMLLRAKVLLAAGRAGESLALLKRINSDAVVGALSALAAIRSGDAAEKVLSQARKAVADTEEAELRWLWLGVMAEAAQILKDSANQIIALEQILPLETSVRVASSERRLFQFSAEQLWASYLNYADKVGNREQLLQGDDNAWFSAAEQTETRYPVRRRSLFVKLAQQASEQTLRDDAHQALLAMYEEMGDDGVELLQALYLDGGQYSDRRYLPASVGYRLVDEAIRKGDLALASELMLQLPKPPGETEQFAWQMRRAKVFLLAGDYTSSDNLLSQVVPRAGALSDPQRDQLVQLLFDLQAVNEHERAYRLLAEMYRQVPAVKLRRELLFWMADSRKAQASHVEAARLYLRSATLSDNNSMDPWAQTARYQAAKSLSEAGMVEDAREIYQQLLKVTENPKRRSVLRHELHQLRLQRERG